MRPLAHLLGEKLKRKKREKAKKQKTGAKNGVSEPFHTPPTERGALK
jgi:hypothetical protein